MGLGQVYWPVGGKEYCYLLGIFGFQGCVDYWRHFVGAGLGTVTGSSLR